MVCLYCAAIFKTTRPADCHWRVETPSPSVNTTVINPVPTLRVLLAALCLVGSFATTAQTYPVKPVRYIVPSPAAASPDIIARLLAERLSRMWNQQVVIDNRSGAGGTLGAAFAAKSPADGYTLFQCNIASSAIAESLYAKVPYNTPRDFAAIKKNCFKTNTYSNSADAGRRAARACARWRHCGKLSEQTHPLGHRRRARCDGAYPRSEIH